MSGADLAFSRLVQLALLKIEFVDRGSKAKERGRAIVDLRRWGIELEKIATTDEDDGEVDAKEDEDDEVTRVAGRRYWAGGFGEPERLAEFKAGEFWPIGWARDSTKPAVVNTWKGFASIQLGDYFAIKGP